MVAVDSLTDLLDQPSVLFRFEAAWSFSSSRYGPGILEFELRRSLLAMFAERSFLADCDKNGKENTVDCTDQTDGIVNPI